MFLSVVKYGNNPFHYWIGKPHNNNPNNHESNNTLCFLHFFFIPSSCHQLETRVDDIDNSNDRYKSQKIDDNILDVHRKFSSCLYVIYPIFKKIYSSFKTTGNSITVGNTRSISSAPETTCKSRTDSKNNSKNCQERKTKKFHIFLRCYNLLFLNYRYIF